MIKVASCGNIRLEEGGVAEALAATAREHGAPEYSLDEFETPVELIESASAALSSIPYDLVICAFDLAGVTGVHAVSELNDLYSYADDLRVVLCAPSSEHAFAARQSGVDGFIIEPISQLEFNRVVGRQLIEICALHGRSVIVRCRDRVRRISFERVSYVETSGHDQVIHHIGSDETFDVRGSSRDLFALLEDDDRFFKVGSSHIVNLDHVAAFDSKEGLATLNDGMQVPVPVRSRKVLEQTLISRGQVVV